MRANEDPDRLARLYAALANEEDARVCRDISDEACRDVPSSFFRILAASSLTKLGDALASPKTTLAWVLGTVQAPAAFLAWLVPIRESGSMLPQLLIASAVRRRPIRKWLWVVGSVAQCGALAGLAATAAFLRGATAGAAVLACLVAFSLARGLCSVASKDVLGKTVPRTRRGRLGGLSATVSGVLTVAIGLWMLLRSDQDPGAAFYGALMAAAAGLWLVAAIVYAGIREEPGATEGGKNAIVEAWRRLALLRTDRPFRRFVGARALLLCSALSAPYFVALARENVEGGVGLLGLFILANGLASSLSANVWGRLADVSSRRIMVAGGSMAGLLGIALVGAIELAPALSASRWTYVLAFMLLGVAHTGVRLGRKTYVVDMAQGNRRTDYVAVGNTVIGALLLVAGSIGALSPWIGTEGVLLVLAAMGLAGSAASWSLPEVQE